MAEYIEREALIAEFKRLTLVENSLIERFFADGVYAVLETFPASDVVEVKHGRWLPQRFLGRGVVDCSECATLGSLQWKWCPVCGSKMDGERKEQ